MGNQAERIALEDRVGNALACWVQAVARSSGTVLLCCAGIFAICLALTVARLGIQSDKNALFPDSLRFRVLEDRYFAALPVLAENLVVVIEAETAEATRSATRHLAAELEADPEHFRDVYVPAHPFFERNGLLFLDLAELEAITNRLARLQPMLAAVVRDPSLVGLLDPLTKTLEALRTQGVSDSDSDLDLEVARILEKIEATLAAAEAGRPGTLDWSEVVRLGDGSRNPRRQVIYLTPLLDYGSMAAAEEAIETLRALIRGLGSGEGTSVRVRITGDMMLNFEEMKLLRTQVGTAGFASFMIVSLLLFAALRSWRLVLATVLSLTLGLVCTTGFAAVAIGHLNMISVAFAVLFIGLGVDFGIHLCMRYSELSRGKEESNPALTETARGVGSSLVLCALTTSVGFFAFVPTEFIGVAELGLIAGAGMFIGLASSFTMIPAIISRYPAGIQRARVVASRSALGSWPGRFPRWVITTALALAISAALWIPQIRFDQNPLNVRDPAAESVRVYAELVADRSGNPWSLNYLAANEAEAREIKTRFESVPEVDEVRGIWDYVPDQQVEKLAVIEEMSLFADWQTTQRAIADRAPSSNVATQRASIAALISEVESRGPLVRGTQLDRAADALRNRLVTLNRELDQSAPETARLRIFDLETRLLVTFKDPLARLERALGASAFTTDDLPVELRDRMISANGQIRVEILPRDDLASEGALDRFVLAAREVSDDVMGPAVSIYDSAQAVVGALREAFTSALIVIVAILFLIWRRVGDVALVMIPLIWAGLMTGGAMVLFGIDFNFADVIVLPLLLGIGVDSGIHMVHRARIEGGEGESLLATSTARAVVFSALTTIASFGSLALVPHLGMASLGKLLVIGVSWTVVANLIVLPALLALVRPAAERVRD